jgi:hypothetical protein
MTKQNRNNPAPIHLLRLAIAGKPGSFLHVCELCWGKVEGDPRYSVVASFSAAQVPPERRRCSACRRAIVEGN